MRASAQDDMVFGLVVSHPLLVKEWAPIFVLTDANRRSVDFARHDNIERVYEPTFSLAVVAAGLILRWRW
jgi:hypothetical protein